jgi:hypothetical protein
MGNTCKKKQKNYNNTSTSEGEDYLIGSNIQSTGMNSVYGRNSKRDEENYKEYFKLIKMKLRRFYEENQHNQFNISISLDKKDFNTVTTAKKIIINPSQKFIVWKDYLINYLEKQVARGYNWANDLLE